MAKQALSAPAFRSAYPGESDAVEFKQGVSEQKIAEAVTAFSNAAGGTVLIGVGPDGTVHGTNVDGEARARLHRVVGTVHQPGRYELAPIEVEDRFILAVRVARREEGFAQSSDGRVLVRRDAMNVALIGEDLAEFVAQHALRRFERTPLEVEMARVDSQCLAALASAWGWSGDLDDRLAEHGFVRREGIKKVLTVAGALYLLADPSKELGKVYVEVFRYRDDGPTEDKRYAIHGPLPRLVRETTSSIVEEIGHDVVVLGLRRHELERVPLSVLREAVANAVAHRVYEDQRRPIRVEIRPSRVVITSPGPLPEPVSVETMREQNAARNIVVIAALRRFRLAEDAGRGVDLMQDVMAEHLLDPPRFEADTNSVTVTLPLTSAVTTSERAWVAEIEARGELKTGDRLLLVHAARGQALTNSRVRELLGVDSTHARAALQRLRDAGFLRQEGETSGARYVLSASLGAPAGLRLSQEDLRGMIVELAHAGPITNRSVRDRLALDRVTVLRLLQGLVEDGTLAMQGERRTAEYVLTDRAQTH